MNKKNFYYDIGTPQFFKQKFLNSISFIVICVCISLFLLMRIVEILQIISRDEIIAFLGLSYYGIVKYLWFHQFVTSPFLHANIFHLLFNMLTLWFLGPSIENKLNKFGYIALSFISALFASVGFLIVNWGTQHIVVGYSGVIFGILVAQAMFFPEQKIIILGFFPMKMKYAVLLFAAVEFYLTVSPGDNVVSHISHLFGAVGAFLYLKISQKFLKHHQLKRKIVTLPKGLDATDKIRIKHKIPKKL